MKKLIFGTLLSCAILGLAFSAVPSAEGGVVGCHSYNNSRPAYFPGFGSSCAYQGVGCSECHDFSTGDWCVVSGSLGYCVPYGQSYGGGNAFLY
jgi:hypothetical protein